MLGVRRKSGTESFSGAGKQARQEDVWRQDDFVCQFCGFRAEKFQRVVAGSWIGQPRSGLTACVFCEPCFALETVGVVSSGYLIWLPEITQAELNHLCRAIYLARQEGEEMAARGQTAFDALLSRRGEAKKRLGSDEPLLLGTALLENLSAQEYEARGKKLNGIRLLPLNRRLVTVPGGNAVDQFPAILEYWRSLKGPCSRMPPQDWLKLFAA
ncbi:MAG: type IV secretion protein DotN [Alphaproteobacteria bacterium]